MSTKAELDEIRERYRLATAAAKVGVWDWNIETGEFHLDPNVKGFLGYEDHEIPNDLEQWSRHIHPDDRDAVFREAQSTIDGRQEEYVFEHRMLHRDGSVRWFLVRGAVIRDAAGKPVRFVGTDADITERKALEEKLGDLSSEIQSQIGRDLHDSLAQDLTGLKLLLNSLEQGVVDGTAPSRAQFDKLYSVLDCAIERTRSLAFSLSPMLNNGLGLWRALEKLARYVTDIHGVHCAVSVDAGIGVDDASRADQLYRIAQQAIVNAAQHSNANRIDLTVTRANGWLTLRVADDGVGLGEPGPEAGMGMKIMNHRARSLGGSLEVSARDEGGTLVTCRCPLQNGVSPDAGTR